MSQPSRPKVYHITHGSNLAKIARDGCLYSDTLMVERGGAIVVGMASIKARRLRLPVRCHPGDFVGDYVPSARDPGCSIPFTRPTIWRSATAGGRTPSSTWRWTSTMWCGGQIPAAGDGRSRCRTRARADLDKLGEINWGAVNARDWNDSDLREGKQAEFLLQESCPFDLISRIGVISEGARRCVLEILEATPYAPVVDVMRNWCY